jgi:hypothetical protein
MESRHEQPFVAQLARPAPGHLARAIEAEYPVTVPQICG